MVLQAMILLEKLLKNVYENQMEAMGNCDDGDDNDCDGDADWDSLDGTHGDDGCPVGIDEISIGTMP